MSLRSLTDKALVEQLYQLTRRERQTSVEILQHIGEVERRKLHFALGYRSLFAYCTEHLGYSNSGAGRRVAAARCIRRYPLAARLLQRGRVNLTSLAMVAGSLTPDNADELLGRIDGRTQPEVEAIVAGLNPLSHVRDRVKPVCVRVPVAASAAPARRDNGAAADAASLSAATGSNPRAHAAPVGNHSHNGNKKSTRNFRTIQKMQIQFAAGSEFMAKLERVRSLLSTSHPEQLSLEQLFEIIMDGYLEKHDPRERAKRRAVRDKQKALKKQGDIKGARTRRAGSAAKERPQSRYVPPATRDAVYARDRGRCTYKGATGKRCASRHNLHVDHIVPHAGGGSNALSNLRLLCANHNRLEAERLMGAVARRYTRRE